LQNAKHCFPTVFIYIEVAFKCSGQLQLKLYFSVLIENCIYKNFSIYYVREKFVKHKVLDLPLYYKIIQKLLLCQNIGEYKNTKNKTVGLQSLAICKPVARQ